MPSAKIMTLYCNVTEDDLYNAEEGKDGWYFENTSILGPNIEP
jgi:hypothetical protein